MTETSLADVRWPREIRGDVDAFVGWVVEGDYLDRHAVIIGRWGPEFISFDLWRTSIYTFWLAFTGHGEFGTRYLSMYVQHFHDLLVVQDLDDSIIRGMLAVSEHWATPAIANNRGQLLRQFITLLRTSCAEAVGGYGRLDPATEERESPDWANRSYSRDIVFD